LQGKDVQLVEKEQKMSANQCLTNKTIIANQNETDIVAKVSAQMPEENFLYDVAELFKIFGDSTRIRILTALQKSELNVCDIASVLNMTKSAVSHQLRILRQAKLVKNRRVGKEIFYSLDDEHVHDIIEIAIAHLHHAK
jgi:ArsR family transcriptional regulator